MNTAERLWGNVSRKPDGCWRWMGLRTADGYGRLRVAGRMVLAHRLAWELTNGPIEPGLCVCHRCDVRDCCNPEHLFLGTPAQNAADRDEKGRQCFQAGERGPNAKLTAAQVQAIRERVAAGVTQASLAREFGVSNQTISAIKRGHRWKEMQQ